jgi:pyruvate ferredoxin oxidoreductase gamma subunit
MLKQIRIHGRGGQGVVTFAQLLALAAYYDGKKVQAFPSFGVERRGAPVESYVRISDREITRRDHITNPDYFILVDSTLLTNKSILNGLDKSDFLLINSKKNEDDIRRYFAIYPDVKIKSIDAIELALQILGKPIINTAMLGAFACLTGLISMNGVKKAIKDKFIEKGQDIVRENIDLAQKAYDHFDPHKQFVVIPGEQELMIIGEDKIAVDS